MTAASNPWEQRATALASGFDPYSTTAAAARRRSGDAGHGRAVVVPVYVSRSALGGDPSVSGLLVRLAPGGALALDPGAYPADLAPSSPFWAAVHAASHEPQALARRDGWVRVTVDRPRPAVGGVDVVLRESDWAILRSALRLRLDPSAPQDAAAEQVLGRYLGRLDGEDGTRSAGLWGRLALEVISRRHPGRLADTLSLRWHASWGVAGFPAGSGGRAAGSAGSPTLLDLRHQRVVVDGRSFRVRTLPEWEREQAADDLGMPPRRVLAWPVGSLASLLARFDDIAPAPLSAEGVHDAPPPRGSGPQDSV